MIPINLLELKKEEKIRYKNRPDIYGEDLEEILKRDTRVDIPRLTGQLSNFKNLGEIDRDVSEGVELIVFTRKYNNQFELKDELSMLVSNIRKITFLYGGSSLDKDTLGFIKMIIDVIPNNIDISFPELEYELGEERYVLPIIKYLIIDRGVKVKALTFPSNILMGINNPEIFIDTVLSNVTDRVIFINSYIRLGNRIPESERNNRIKIIEDMGKDNFRLIVDTLGKHSSNIDIHIVDNLIENKDSFWSEKDYNRKINLNNRIMRDIEYRNNLNLNNLKWVIKESEFIDLIDEGFGVFLEETGEIILIKEGSYIKSSISSSIEKIIDLIRDTNRDNHIIREDIREKKISNIKDNLKRSILKSVVPCKVVKVGEKKVEVISEGTGDIESIINKDNLYPLDNTLVSLYGTMGVIKESNVITSIEYLLEK